MDEQKDKIQPENNCACDGECDCEGGSCECKDTECCEGGCGCGYDDGYTTDDFDAEYTPAEQYALLAEEAYKEIIKEKLKVKFLAEHKEIDQVVEIAYQACRQRWNEMNNDTYEEEKWDKLDTELSKIWKS